MFLFYSLLSNLTTLHLLHIYRTMRMRSSSSDTCAADDSLRVCVHSGPSCCSSKMEDNYMTAVRMLFFLSSISSLLFSFLFVLVLETFESLVSFTSNLTSTLFDNAYSALALDCRPLVLQLFDAIKLHLSGDTALSLEKAVNRFYDDLFPLVYRRHFSSSVHSGHDDCLRMTRQDVSPFGPHPRLLVSSLSRALGLGRALSRLLKLAGEVINATEKASLSRECGRSLVKMHYCSHCRGLTLIRPCTGLCVNVMRGCLVSARFMRHPCCSMFFHSFLPSFREFESSIQRYQWFFSELPEMLCESEMEVEQHTCWSGQDVVESYAGRVVGSSVKAQRENPEMTVRNSDSVLKGSCQLNSQTGHSANRKPEEKCILCGRQLTNRRRRLQRGIWRLCSAILICS
uniref:Uncharacterized protein n=1 Tax=Neogobius melanostomus TaxID=47308 RepID=A0A8C6V5D7_9GOBI